MLFRDHAKNMRADAARYNPENMYAFFREVSQWPEAFGDVAGSMRIMTQKVEQGFPLDKAIVEQIAALHSTLIVAAKAAESIAPAMRALHAEDFKRYESPRQNEKLWNV